MVTIRLFGTAGPSPDLQRALQEHLTTVTFGLGHYAEDCLSSDIVQSDLLLCFLDAANSSEAVDFIGRVIARHGVWIYLPVVVVGQPADPEDQQRLYRCGPALQLRETLGPDYLA